MLDGAGAWRGASSVGVSFVAVAALASCTYPQLPRLTTCGRSGIEDCSGAAMIPGGAFHRSDDPLAPATVSAFSLDTYEVTVGRFRAFVDAGLGTQVAPPMPGTGAHPHLPGSGWDSAWDASLMRNAVELTAALHCASDFETWNDVPGDSDGKPIACVTWYEAMAFCIWDGGYLPTEAEWNYAASGGSEQRAYPWSTPASSMTIDCSHANYRSSNDPIMFCVNDPQGGATRVGNKSPQGNGKWGHADLGGNASEWTLDYYAAEYLAECNDCANLTVSTDRVRRGGSFNVVASNLRTSFRAHALSTERNANLGIRCARSP